MSTLNLNRIGALLKRQRIAHGYSIRDLSALSNVSAGTISQIETGKSSPNIVSIHAICQTLRFPISALFLEESADQIKLVRKNERSSFVRNTSNGKEIMESMITKAGSKMWAGIITMPPHSDSGDYYYHSGEEFVFILNGELTFLLENNPPFLLKKDDTLYYPNIIGHRWENQTDETVNFLIVSTTDYLIDGAVQ